QYATGLDLSDAFFLALDDVSGLKENAESNCLGLSRITDSKELPLSVCLLNPDHIPTTIF
ncbi:MAG: hypothetical protein RRZ38_15500, partial [Hafnia sp.]